MPTKTEDEVRIGDFSRPVVPPPAKGQKAGAPASPSDKRLEAAEAAIDKEAAEVQQALTPLEAYENRLQEIGVGRADAADMVDSLLEKGFWSEEVPVTSRIKVCFRTRTYRDVERMRNYLEVARPTHPDYYNDILYKYQLASSLVRYKDVSFAHATKKETKEKVEELFNLRLAFVDELSDPMFRLLAEKLRKFDEKVRIVFEEGAIENF